jgi:hypothetical protein
MTESEPTAPPPRAAFVFLFITVLLDMLALGIVVPAHLFGVIKDFGQERDQPTQVGTAILLRRGRQNSKIILRPR